MNLTQFPITDCDAKDKIKSVPWNLIEPYREVIQKVHNGQTLERLAVLGGLSITEIALTIGVSESGPMDVEKATALVRKHIEQVKGGNYEAHR